MSEQTEAAAGTIAGGKAALKRIRATVDTAAARLTLAGQEYDRQMRERVVVGGAIEDDLPGETLDIMRVRKAARLDGERRNVGAEAKTTAALALEELRAMGAAFSKGRFIRELAAKPEALSARMALEGAPVEEILATIDEAIQQANTTVAVVGSQVLARRTGVDPALSRKAKDLLDNLAFPARSELLAEAEAIREQAARTLIAAVETCDGQDASVNKLAVIRQHLAVQRGPDGQVEHRPPPPPIWG